MRLDELGCKRRSRGRIDRGSFDDQRRFLEPVVESYRFARAASRRTEANHQAPIRVENVLPGALPVPSAGEFGDEVAIGDPTVLGESAFRAPTSVRKAGSQSRVQSTAVDTRIKAARVDTCWWQENNSGLAPSISIANKASANWIASNSFRGVSQSSPAALP